MILEAIEDVAGLVPWANQNHQVLDDDRTWAACEDALGSRVEPEFAFGLPLYAFPDPTLPTLPLILVLMNYSPTGTNYCDRCGRTTLCTDRLLIPLGATVVAVHVCPRCYRQLNRAYPDLCWD